MPSRQPRTMSRPTAWAAARPTTVCATPSSPVRDTGESLSRFIIRTVFLFPSQSRSFLSVFLKSVHTSLRRTANRLLQGPRTGPTRAILSRRALCLVSRDPVPTICAIWIRTTTRPSSAVKPTGIGGASTFMSAAPNMLRGISSTPASGTSSSMTSDTSARTSLSASW